MELISGEWGKPKSFPLPLITYGATDFLSGVTLAVGDVKVSLDGAAFEDIATLPTILGAWMIFTLSAAEMQAGSIAVQVIDQTGTKVFEDTGAILATSPRAWNQALFSLIESQRGTHTGVHDIIFWDPIGGLDTNSGLLFHDAKKTYDFVDATGGVHSLLADNLHQIVIMIPNAAGGPTTVNEYVEVDKAYTFMRGPGRDFLIQATHNETCAVMSSAEGVELSGFRVETRLAGNQDGVCTSGDFCRIRNVHVDYSRGSGIVIDNASSCFLEGFVVQDAAQGGTGHAVHILGDTLTTERNIIRSGRILSNDEGNNTDGIRVDGSNCAHNFIIGSDPDGLIIHANSGWGINEVNNANHTMVVGPRIHLQHNTLGAINLTGAQSIAENIEQWGKEGADGDTLKTLSDQIDPIPTDVSTLLASVIVSEKVDTLLDINKPLTLTVDTTTTLEYQWLDVNGDPVDITGRVFTFKAVANAGDSPAAIPEVTGTIQDGPNGRWSFAVLPTSSFKGRYEIWVLDGAVTSTLTRAGGAKMEVVARL